MKSNFPLHTEVRISSFEEINFPETVYKYRSWKEPFHRELLTERKVWFAKPSSFKDPYDCKIPIRYDLLTTREIFEVYYSDSKELHPEWTRRQHREFAMRWSKKSMLRDKGAIERHRAESFKRMDDRLGILSLTANPTNKIMWNNYSVINTGFCLGFDPKILFKYLSGGSIVTYYEKLPDILPRPFHSIDTQMHLQVYSKQKIWDYEEEYRVYKICIISEMSNWRSQVLPIETFKEIIFGANMGKEEKDEIKSLVKDDFSKIKLLQAIIKADGSINLIDEPL